MTCTEQAVISVEGGELLSKKLPEGNTPSPTAVAPGEVSRKQSEALLGTCLLGAGGEGCLWVSGNAHCGL